VLASPTTARTCVMVSTAELSYNPEAREFAGYGSHLTADGFDPAATQVLALVSERTGRVERFDRMPGAERERERVYASRTGLVIVLHVCEW
jgi:hypothetical protein